MALLSLATFASDQGDRDRSEELARRSLPLLAAGGRRHDHVYALHHLALTIDPASGEAEALLQEADSEARALDDRVVLNRVLHARAARAARVGELQDARTLLNESLEHRAGDDDRAYALTWLAIVEIEENDLSRGRDLIAEARELTEGQVTERTLAAVKLVSAQVELLLGNAAEAARHLRDISDIIETSASYLVAVLRLCEAALHRLRGDVSAAEDAWRRAEEVRTQLGFEWELTDALVAEQVVGTRQ